MKVSHVIHVSYTILYGEQPKDIVPAVAERTGLVLIIEGEEHVIDNSMSHRRKPRGFQFLTFMKRDLHHKGTLIRRKDFVDNDGTVTEVLQKYNQECEILTVLLTRKSTERD